MIPIRKSFIKLPPVIFIFFLLLFYCACRKDSKTTTQTSTNTTVLQAKQWYESLYPVNVNTQKSITQGIKRSGSSLLDFSQFILPDWTHAVTYTRLGEQVIEMPIDSSTFYGFDFKNATANKIYSNRKYNRSFFVLLNDGKGYKAYIMMIMADSVYVNNDLTKLTHNSYRKHDPDFTGMVLYFTPKGQYVSGCAYKNGALIIPSSAVADTTSSSTNKIKVDVAQAPPSQDCTDWYLDTYVNDVLVSSEYVGTTCDGTDPETSSGGGSDSPPPVVCQTSSGGGSGSIQSVRGPVINVADPNPPSGGSGGTGTNPTSPTNPNPTNPTPPPDGGFPPPDDDEQCTIVNTDKTVNMSNVPLWGADMTQTYAGSCVFMNMEIVGDILGVNVTEQGLIDAYATETSQQPSNVEQDGIVNNGLTDFSNTNNFINQYFNETSISSDQITTSIDNGNPVMGYVITGFGIGSNGQAVEYGHEVTIYSYSTDGNGTTTYNYIDTTTGTSQSSTNASHFGDPISLSKK
jgi:hypothetical protein